MLTILAGFSTILGGALVFFVEPKKKFLSIAMGFSAGVMIYLSFVELLPESVAQLGYLKAVISFFVGMLIIYIVDVLLPHSYESESSCKCNDLDRCGKLVALGIGIHNFPEGIAVLFSSMYDIRIGLTVALATALHNIPEGVAVAMPIYCATKKKTKAILYSALSGLAEPVGAIVAYLFLHQFLSTTLLSIVLAAVAGVMVFISFDELLPHVYESKSSHPVIFGIFLGMLVMAVGLYIV